MPGKGEWDMKYGVYARGIDLIFGRHFQRKTAALVGTEASRAIMGRAKRLYREMVLRSPSIGRRNPLLINVLIAAYVAAVYRAAGGRVSSEQMGLIFSDAVAEAAAFRIFMQRMAKQVFTRRWQDRCNHIAIESRKRTYPADFVSEFFYGETVNEYRINYLECGICKLLEREGCGELAPYLCRFDYVMARHMGCTLTRTKTIGTGGDLCDFRYTKG